MRKLRYMWFAQPALQGGVLWQNNSLALVAWQNNSAAIIAWLATSNAVYVNVPTNTVLVTAQPPTATVGGSNPYAIRAPQGGDLYVDTTAGVDGSGTFASPWNTMSSARFQSLTAGQSLWARNGSSITLPDTRTLGSGTSGSHIQFASYPGDTRTTIVANGVPFGGGNYWDWFNLDVTTTATLGVDFGNGSGTFAGATCPISNWRFIDCTGRTTATANTDNAGILMFSSVSYPSPEVDNITVIRGSYGGPITSGGSSQNNSGIFVDAVPHFTIIGAYCYGCQQPLYFKHNPGSGGNSGTVLNGTQQSGLVKNCIFGATGRDLEAQRSYVTWENCAFDCQFNIGADGGGANTPYGGHSALCTIDHCTFSPNSATLNDAGFAQFLTLTNNVFSGSCIFYNNPYASGLLNTTSDYSAVSGAGTVHFRNNSTTYSLSAWHTFSGNEAHGVAGSLSLVGGSTPGSTPANWALLGGSVGIGAASDGKDCGVISDNLLTVN